MRIGATYLGDETCEFSVWAPLREDVALRIVVPEARTIPMTKVANGYWETLAENIPPGTSYLYRLDDSLERPDPASNLQSLGVHRASEVVDHGTLEWGDQHWLGIALPEMIIYELHVGTFSPEGTFEAIIPRLDALKQLGANAIELMPVAQFPGKRNWGYDGVYPYAVQSSYGGPIGLKRLVEACHMRGMSVVLDVVYNHLGPEGNYLRDFGPYFTDKYRTPWGEAINFDGAFSDEVRNFFIENALFWFQNYHIDALRLDAIHAIFDFSAKHFLQELAERVDALSRSRGRSFYLIAESNLNDARIIRSPDEGGYGIDAQWCDDFHHSLRTVISGERSGYYMDFGELEQLAKSFNQGTVYTGQYSRYRKRRHGNDASDRPAHQFVVCSQNHDQIGNRMLGERLSTLVPFEGLKLVAGTVMLSPYIPLLFMGEEYGEEAPFLYFIDHSDSDLIEAVRHGRKDEFRGFEWQGEPPDPQNEGTFLQSRLRWLWQKDEKQSRLREFYRTLILQRRQIPALASLDNKKLEAVAIEEEKVLLLRRWHGDSHILSIFNFNDTDVQLQFPFEGEWKKILDSAEEQWSGPGTASPTTLATGSELTIRQLSFSLYESV